MLRSKRDIFDEVGNWLSRDPIGVEGGINLYGYVSNAPVNSLDQLGLLGQHITPEQAKMIKDSQDRNNRVERVVNWLDTNHPELEAGKNSYLFAPVGIFGDKGLSLPFRIVLLDPSSCQNMPDTVGTVAHESMHQEQKFGEAFMDHWFNKDPDPVWEGALVRKHVEIHMKSAQIQQEYDNSTKKRN